MSSSDDEAYVSDEESKSKPGLLEHVFILDFDGAFTMFSGAKTVNSQLYKSLTNWNGTDKYNYAALNLNDNFQATLVEGLKSDENSLMRMTEEGVDFLSKISNDPDSKIFIVSNNKEQYIRAMFAIKGINMERIEIVGVTGGKGNTIEGLARKYDWSNVKTIGIADDEEKYLSDMEKAVKTLNENEWVDFNISVVLEGGKGPGNINWTSLQPQSDLKQKKDEKASEFSIWQPLEETKESQTKAQKDSSFPPNLGGKK